MEKKPLYERFAAVELLKHLVKKITFLFKPQLYLISVLKEALRRSRMVGILGREGMGKSSAIAQFMQEAPNVYYVRVGKSYNVNNLFDELIYQVSGVYPRDVGNKMLFNKMKTLSGMLVEDNSKKLIIIDDAGALNPRQCQIFSEFRDNTMHTTSLVFVGLDYFQEKLSKAKNRGVPGIAEFYRRVENWYRLPSIPEKEKSDYAKKQGLTDDQVLEVLAEKPETIAELENLVNAILEEAKEAAKEERTAKKTSVPGKKTPTQQKAEEKVARESDQTEYDDDDEIEDALKQKKKESAARARAARTSKPKPAKTLKTLTSDVASS